MTNNVLPGKTLLIVDDEPELRGPLVCEFESLGCHVFEAQNGREAFEIIKREKIDAVVSDIRMPGGDGIELLKNIQSLQHKVPVVMLITGFSDLSREDAYHFGAEAILAKPFELDEIEQAVTKMLTPREVLWDNRGETKNIRIALDQEFAGFSETSDQDHLRLGRGGFFVPLPNNLPLMGEKVALKIKLSCGGELTSIEGTGIVRWSRHEDAEGLMKGCGVEFESLNDQTRQGILKFTNSGKLKSYIPKL